MSREIVRRLLIRDPHRFNPLIRERKRREIDRHDEVWNGTYVVLSPPTLAQQELVGNLGDVFRQVVKKPGLGQTYPGARPQRPPQGVGG